MNRSTLFLITLILAIFCILIQTWWKSSLGLYIFAICTLLFLLHNNYRYRRILNWSKSPNNLPAYNLGEYEQLATPLYKYIRKQANETYQLKNFNSLLIASAQALPMAAIILDSNLRVSWCNHLVKSYLGIDSERDNGLNLLNLILNPEFRQYIERKQWQKPFITQITTEENTRTLSFDITHNDQGGYLLSCIDITYIERLRTTQSDFVANVSHEIRTPLTVLIGFLETLRDLPPEAISTEQRQQYEQLMLEQAQRMQVIVADLLTLSTLESSQLKDGETLQFSLLIEVARRQIKNLSGGQHEFSYDIDESLTLYGNRNELLSAITNLLTNAVRYTPSGGKIHVSWSKNKQGQLIFSVADTGVGIAAKDLSRLTERFYRVDKSRSRASGGTGLGLAITKHITIRHNAKLEIQSTLNKGSTFSIVFKNDHNNPFRQQNSNT